jgi:hypothetical protein
VYLEDHGRHRRLDGHLDRPRLQTVPEPRAVLPGEIRHREVGDVGDGVRRGRPPDRGDDPLVQVFVRRDADERDRPRSLRPPDEHRVRPALDEEGSSLGVDSFARRLGKRGEFGAQTGRGRARAEGNRDGVLDPPAGRDGDRHGGGPGDADVRLVFVERGVDAVPLERLDDVLARRTLSGVPGYR